MSSDYYGSIAGRPWDEYRQSTTACCPRQTIPDSCGCLEGCGCLCADCDCGTGCDCGDDDGDAETTGDET
jgi:hypothetical protein